MELYQLKASTLAIVDELRRDGTSSVNHIRGNGKSTALLIRAKELLDQANRGYTVFVLTHDPRLYTRLFKDLFPKSVGGPTFIGSDGLYSIRNGARGWQLIDEPGLVRYRNGRAYRDVIESGDVERNFRIETVGRY